MALRSSKSTNSPTAAAVALVGLVLAFALGGWAAAAVYSAGYLIGGFGTGVNAMRAERAKVATRA